MGQAFDLSLLKPPATLLLKIETSYGRKFEMPFAPLSYHRYQEIGAEVPDPPVPRTGLDVNGKPIPNPADPEYRAALINAETDRNLRRMADGMARGGVELPGDTLAEKAAWLRDNIDAAIAYALLEAVTKYSRQGAARIQDRADSF